MAGLIERTRQFFHTATSDVKERVLLKLTGLIPSSPSMESILSLLEESSPFCDLNYSKMLNDSVPDLQIHADQEHEQMMEPLHNCPWCNNEFFKWLVKNGHFSFIGIIANRSVEDPYPTFELPSSNTDIQGNTDQFHHFIKREKPKKTRRRQLYRKAKKTENWRADSTTSLVNIEANAITEVADYADHNRFEKLPRSQEKVREWVTGNCIYNSDDLETYPAYNNLFVLPAIRYLIRPNIPKYLFMRFDKVIPNDIQDALWNTWCNMRDKISKFEKKQNRDIQPQIHLGIWQHYRKIPYIISDTIRQTLEAQKEIEAFMNLLRLNVAWRLWALLRRYDPETFARVMRVRDFFQSDTEFLDLLDAVGHADFGGIFYAIAVKEGGSQIIHLDWMDHIGTYAWVITIGPGWVGGDICFPQLGRKVPMQPGQVLAFQGRYLAHCASPNTGNRLVITCFTDRNLMNRALAAIEEYFARPSKKARHN